MVKAVLSAVLVATQLLSWNVSPLYLCVGADGSLGFDFGPLGCGGCRHEGPEDECCAGHEEHGDHACDQAVAGDPCGCTHIQISEPQAATLGRPAVAPDASRWAISPLAATREALLPGCGAQGCAASASPWLESPPTAPPHLASVVMRC